MKGELEKGMFLKKIKEQNQINFASVFGMYRESCYLNYPLCNNPSDGNYCY